MSPFGLGEIPNRFPTPNLNILTWKTGAIPEVIECLLAPVTDSGDLTLAGWSGANCLTSLLAPASSSVQSDGQGTSQRTGVRIKGDNLYRVLHTKPGSTFLLLLSHCPGVPRVVEPHLMNLTPSDLLTPW